MKIRSFKTSLKVALFLAFGTSVNAQSTLQEYVEYGLQSNRTLKQKQHSLTQAKSSLEVSRSYFMPSVNLLGDYTSGKGGRAISIPIGDLMNPVYTTLNELTESNNFPQVENVNQDFFPHNFYDAKVRTSVPIINTDLIVGRTISQQKVMVSQYELDAYRRDLILHIKSAYFNYRSALAAIDIQRSALELLSHNVSVNESLLKNGKSLPANYLRAKSEYEKIKADVTTAVHQAENSKKYFNFLLNRDLNEDIVISEDLPVPSNTSEASVIQREEIFMLKTVEDINVSSLQLYKLSRLPKVSAFLDLGTQASDWDFNRDSRYYLFGVQLSVPVFQGFRNNLQIRKARLDVENTRLDLERTSKQLQVAADIAASNLTSSQQNYAAAQDQLISAKSYYHLIDKGYQQGINSQIEFIDARNQLTASELQVNLRKYETLIAAAQLERETSSYHLTH